MKKPSVITQIVIAVVAGVLVGFLIPASGNYLKTVGDVFLRLMQMAIPILILGQIVQAVGSTSPKELTSLRGRATAVFGISSLVAALWGVLMAVIFSPGHGVKMTGFQDAFIKTQEVSTIDTILNFVPKNIFDSLTRGSTIQTIVFALFFGLVLNKYLRSHPETQFFQIIVDFNEVIITVIRYVMYLAPLGIFALIASTISHLGLQIILPLVKYLLVYGLGTILSLGIWVLVIILYCKVSPLCLTTNTKNMSVMALATTSSAITSPVALEKTETKLGLGKRITNLVLPLDILLNSNGSAMHMAFTVATVAQMYQLDFDTTKMIYLAITATFASLANAVVPGAGLVSLAVIVPQMGLPIESIAIFVDVEWFVGMLRTILNVNSDVYSAILVVKSVDEIDYTVLNSNNK